MNLLTADQILTAPLAFEDVPVPEWGGTVRVREISGADRDAFHLGLTRDAEGRTPISQFNARLLSFTLADGDGKRLFTDEQLKQLQQRGAAVLERVAAVAMKLNGLGGSAAVEEAVKNSEAGQNSGSGSGSQAISE